MQKSVMKNPITLLAALLAVPLAAVSGPAYAQTPRSDIPIFFVPSIPARIEAMPRELPRARGPSLPMALQLAQTAVAVCAAKGGKISALVTDSVGVAVVLLSGDGAGERSQLITITKAATAIKYKLPSGEVAKKAAADPMLRAELLADPNIGVARGGGFPLMKDNEVIGAFAVSGATNIEEDCAKEALAKVMPH